MKWQQHLHSNVLLVEPSRSWSGWFRWDHVSSGWDAGLVHELLLVTPLFTSYYITYSLKHWILRSEIHMNIHTRWTIIITCCLLCFQVCRSLPLHHFLLRPVNSFPVKRTDLQSELRWHSLSALHSAAAAQRPLWASQVWISLGVHVKP